MAAALFRGASRLRCLQRELSRVVWRPQTATFSSEPSDKKLRRTHIKKAKPEPRVEINELVEKIFSQKRPNAAASARSAKSSSNPLSTSSAKRSTSEVPPLSQSRTTGTFLNAASQSKQSNGVSRRAALFTARSFFQPDSSNPQLSNHPSDVDVHSMSASSSPTTAAEPNRAVEITGASVVEDLSEQSVEFSSQEGQKTESTDVGLSVSNKEQLFRESTVETSSSQKEALESSSPALKEEPSRETTVDPQIKIPLDLEHLTDSSKATDQGLVKEELFITYSEESLLESSILVETPTILVEGSVEATQHQAGQKEETKITDSEIIKVSNDLQEELKLKSQIESMAELSTATQEVSPLEAVLSPEGTLETVPESKNEATEAQPTSISIMMNPASETLEDTLGVSSPTVEPVTATTVEDDLSHQELTQAEDVEVRLKEPEKLTLESVTLHFVTSSVESLRTDELHQTQAVLDEKAALVQETECRAAADSGSESEDEGEPLTEALTKWESLSEDLEGLEGEGGMLVNELLCSIPALVSKSPALPNTSSAYDQPKAKLEHSNTNDEDAALTLESVTLAEIKEEVGSLDSEVLQDTCKSLDRETKELEKDYVKREEVVVDMFEDTTEAEISEVFISEATDEAETAMMMEAMFGSEQGPKQPTKESLQELSLKTEPRKDGEDVVEAMSLESVTLAEVEASLGAIENDSLSATDDYLDKESEMLAVENNTVLEEGAVAENTSQDLSFDPLSVPQDNALPEDLETDALVEELLFTVPGHTAKDVKDEAIVNGPEETLGEEEPLGVHPDLDPVQSLFLEKIREYNNVSRDMLEAEPDFLKHLSEETSKLQKLYGGGDLSSFPQFSFTEPELDQEPK